MHTESADYGDARWNQRAPSALPPARRPGAGACAGHSPQTAALGGRAVSVAFQSHLERRHVLGDHRHLTLHQQDVLWGGPGDAALGRPHRATRTERPGSAETTHEARE